MPARLAFSWCSIVRLLLSLLALLPLTAARWHDEAWVREYPCGALRPDFPSAESTPFWIDSFRGRLVTRGDETELTLGILAVQNTSLITCDDIDIDSFKDSLRFEVLGQAVGQLRRFSSECLVPITEDLTPAGFLRFSTYNLTYSFKDTYRFRTLVSTFRFNRPGGEELDCGVAKITPDLGKTISAVLISTTIGILALVAVSSSRSYVKDPGLGSFVDHASVAARHGQLWATVLEMTNYLRHLQFIFISSSMTIEYPGFYVPAVSKVAWSCLLFWTGPLNHGHPNIGIDGGMYVSNASYGLEFMNQAMGYPTMLNTLANSLINFAIFVVPLFLAFTLWLLFRTSPRDVTPTPTSTLRESAALTLGVALCFFSVPMLAIMSYDLILIGYLPNYRIGLAVLMLLVVVGANHFLTQRINHRLLYKSATEGQTHRDELILDLQLVGMTVWRHIPHSLPLLQAISIGSLQDYPVAQLSLLSGFEFVGLLHRMVSRDVSFLKSTATYFSIVRLVAGLLSITFVSSANERSRHLVGYAILGVHGLLVLPGFILKSVYRIYSTRRQGQVALGSFYTNGTGTASSAIPLAHLNQSPPSSSDSGNEYRKSHALESLRQYNAHDESTFYRTPRSRNTPTPEPRRPFHTPEPRIALPTNASLPLNEGPCDLDLAISQISPRAGVDYSVRESDLFYGIHGDSTEMIPQSSSSPLPDQMDDTSPAGSSRYANWKRSFSANFSRARREPQETGFQVVRPARPQRIASPEAEPRGV